MAMNGYYDRNREIREAIAAGERALESLRAAQEKLSSASGWGWVDLLGGNLISGWIKHSRVNEAAEYIDDARRDMAAFQNELRDVQELQGMDIRIGDFLTFADFFFDGFIADVLVQSKISDAKKKVEEAIGQTESVLERLRQSL